MRKSVVLPLPLGPRKPEDLAAPDGQGQVAQGGAVAIGMAEVLDLDDGVLHGGGVCYLPPASSIRGV